MNKTEPKNTTQSPFDENGWNIYPLAKVCSNKFSQSKIHIEYIIVVKILCLRYLLMTNSNLYFRSGLGLLQHNLL